MGEQTSMETMDDRRDQECGAASERVFDPVTWVILATGQSITQDDADYANGKCHTAAVSDAFRLAPWADILVSNDRAWWENHPEAASFSGRKFCSHSLREAEEFRQHVHLGRNSGLMAMFVAKWLGAKRILLLGFDMHGTHFFGPHPTPLKNSTDKIFATHIKQFDGFSGCEVINCTKGSALKRFPYKPLREVL